MFPNPKDAPTAGAECSIHLSISLYIALDFPNPVLVVRRRQPTGKQSLEAGTRRIGIWHRPGAIDDRGLRNETTNSNFSEKSWSTCIARFLSEVFLDSNEVS